MKRLRRTRGCSWWTSGRTGAGPCRALAPVLEDLAAASGGRVTLAKVNLDENLELAERYDIRSIPTVLFFRSGEVVDRITGAVSRAVLQDILNARA